MDPMAVYNIDKHWEIIARSSNVKCALGVSQYDCWSKSFLKKNIKALRCRSTVKEYTDDQWIGTYGQYSYVMNFV